MIDVSVHFHPKSVIHRVDRDNNNAVTISTTGVEFGPASVTLFGLPASVLDALLAHYGPPLYGEGSHKKSETTGSGAEQSA